MTSTTGRHSGRGRVWTARVVTDGAGNPRWPGILLVNLWPGARPVPIDLMQLGAIATFLVVSLASFASIWWFWTVGLDWFDVLIFVTFTYAVGLGVTLGYHRLFCHKAFEASPPVVLVLGILGAASLQGHIQVWVSVHRKHHHHSDRGGDPHSPRAQKPGLMPALASGWDAHVGWLFSGRFYSYLPYIPDLRRDRLVRFIDRWYWGWAALGFLVPGLIGAAWHGTWEGYVSGVLAGGVLRSFYQLNTTWAVNSLGHLFGRRPFLTSDDSSNNTLVNLLLLNGEGLHNNHHAFPWSARFSLRPGDLDVGYWILRLLARAGLVWNIKEPSYRQIESRLVPASQ